MGPVISTRIGFRGIHSIMAAFVACYYTLLRCLGTGFPRHNVNKGFQKSVSIQRPDLNYDCSHIRNEHDSHFDNRKLKWTKMVGNKWREMS